VAHVPPLGLSLEEVRRELDRIRHPFRLAIRRAKNPFNVGAILRTAHSFLPREIVLIGTEPFYERAAMGMHRFEHLREVESEEAFVALARAEGWTISALEKEHAGASLWEAALPDGCVIVVGNEEDGVGEIILEAAAETIAIPMFGLNHSYPMTAAAAMALSEWARRRYAGPGRVVVTPADPRLPRGRSPL
jgi:tRNA G18 (ribose-2'-O)-methylase SpoU